VLLFSKMPLIYGAYFRCFGARGLGDLIPTILQNVGRTAGSGSTLIGRLASAHKTSLNEIASQENRQHRAFAFDLNEMCR
jgi:hypothetical protein